LLAITFAELYKVGLMTKITHQHIQ
jgi:hypothetical protein